MTKAETIFAFYLVIIGAKALNLPDYIKPCSRSDPKFNECALKNGRAAIPRIIKGDQKYDIPVLDPLVVENLSLTYSGINASSSNFIIAGVKDAVIEDFSIDFEKQIIRVSFLIPHAVLNGNYSMAGTLVGLPIYGKGLYEASFDGLSGNYSTNYTLTTLQDGEVYVIPQAYDVEYNLKLMKVHLENLFNGNKFLGDNMNKFLNENWQLVIDDLGKPIFYTLGSIVHRIVSNVSKKFPFKELFAD